MRRRPEISREFVESHRRQRFVRAAATIAHEEGVRAITATNLCQVARTARNSFYDVFPNVNACLAYGVAEAFEHLFSPLREADGTGEWLREVDAAIAGLYAAAAAEPLLAELFLVHSFGVRVEPGQPDFASGTELLAGLLRRGRGETEAGHHQPPALSEEYLSQVVVSLAAQKVSWGETESLAAHAREMTLLVGGTYLGPAEAARILA